MAADSFALTGDAESARERLQLLQTDGQDASEVASQLETLVRDRLEAGRAEEALRLQGLAAAALPSVDATPAPTGPQPPPGPGSGLQRAVGIGFFLVLLAGGVLLLLTQLQKREALRRRRVPTALRQTPTGKGSQPGPTTQPSETALEQFETSYTLADKEYDVSTSVQSPTGEFAGECGVSAIEETRLDDAQGFGGFEVWLFDKDDVRTETKVLLSEVAFADASLREQLSHKGEIIQPQPGQVLSLETANLRLNATITELEFAGEDGAAFANLSTRLEVSPL
jgi:hypothetical protein